MCNKRNSYALTSLIAFITFLITFSHVFAEEVQQAPTVPSPHSTNEADTKSAAQLRDAMAKKLSVNSPKLDSETLSLKPFDYKSALEDGRIKRSSKGKALQVSTNRPVEDLNEGMWRLIKSQDGKYNWRVVIHSPGATFLRPHFTKLPPSDEVYIYGIEGKDSIEGPINTLITNSEGLWGPVVSGEYLFIEVIQDSADCAPKLIIDQISHGFRNIFSGAIKDPYLLKADLFKEDSCYKDVNCYSDWNNTKTGVARIFYSEGSSGYVCTGSLINDQIQSYTNWFLTAYHCISSNSTANTVIAYFNYRTNTCNGTVPNLSSVPKVTGASFISGSSSVSGTDFSLLKLSDSPPSGIYYLGWTTASISSGSAVTSIHHPDGTYQRISFGSESNSNIEGQNWWRILWTTSSTEGGSSGGPLFNSNRQIIGQLRGGDAACANMSGHDTFGKFGVSWDLGLKNYLGSSTSGRSPIYRFFNTQTNTHFYTINESEKNYVIANYPQFRLEGVAYYAYQSSQSGTSPVYRFYNTQTNTHFYTINESEKNYVIANYPLYKFEGAGYYAYQSSQSGTSPIYRFYNTQTNTHFYTINESEKNYVIANYPYYSFDGIGYYAFTSQ